MFEGLISPKSRTGRRGSKVTADGFEDPLSRRSSLSQGSKLSRWDYPETQGGSRRGSCGDDPGGALTPTPRSGTGTASASGLGHLPLAGNRLSEPFREPFSCRGEDAPGGFRGSAAEFDPAVHPLDEETAGEMWDQVWTVFDELEDAWGPSSPNSKATPLRQLFALLSEMETGAREQEKLIAEMRERKLRAVEPVMRRRPAIEASRDAAVMFAAWRLAAQRGAQARLAQSLEESRAELAAHLHRRPSPSVHVDECIYMHWRWRTHVSWKQVWRAWRLFARGRRSHKPFGNSMVRANQIAEQIDDRRMLFSTLLTWHRCTAVGLRDRRQLGGEMTNAGLQEELRQQKELNAHMEKQLEVLGQQHAGLNDHVNQVRRQIEAWHKLHGREISTSGPDSSTVLDGEYLRQMQQEKVDLLRQLRECSDHVHEVADRVEQFQEMADALQARLLRALRSEAEPIRRQLAQALQARQDTEMELEQLQLREARLRQAIEEAEMDVQKAGRRPEKHLKRYLQDMQVQFEHILNKEKLAAQELRETLETNHREMTKKEADHESEKQSWSGQMSTLRVDLKAELTASKERASMLETELNEATRWGMHLKEVSDTKSRGYKQLQSQDVQLGKIREALSDLTDISVQVFGGDRPAGARVQRPTHQAADPPASVQASVGLRTPPLRGMAPRPGMSTADVSPAPRGVSPLSGRPELTAGPPTGPKASPTPSYKGPPPGVAAGAAPRPMGYPGMAPPHQGGALGLTATAHQRAAPPGAYLVR